MIVGQVELSLGVGLFEISSGGWSTGEGGQNVLKTCLRGDEKIVHSFLGGLKNFL